VRLVGSLGRASYLSVFVTAALITAVLAACGGVDATPALQCDPPVVAQTYKLSIGCGTGGDIVIHTAENSCVLSVDNARVAEVPFNGYFLAAAKDGSFNLADGNWALKGNVRFSSSPPLDEDVYCTVAPRSGSAIFDVSCAIQNCTVVGEGEDEGESCSSELCSAVLTPATPEADAGSTTTTTDAASAADAAASGD
jgi:hypothetical protein